MIRFTFSSRHELMARIYTFTDIARADPVAYAFMRLEMKARARK